MKTCILGLLLFCESLNLAAQSKDSMTLDEINHYRLVAIGNTATFWDSIPWYNYVGKDVVFLINCLNDFVAQSTLQKGAVAWLGMAPGLSGNIGYTFPLPNQYFITIKLNGTNYLPYELGKLPDKLSEEDFKRFKLETIYEIQIDGPERVNFCRFTPHGIYGW